MAKVWTKQELKGANKQALKDLYHHFHNGDPAGAAKMMQEEYDAAIIKGIVGKPKYADMGHMFAKDIAPVGEKEVFEKDFIISENDPRMLRYVRGRTARLPQSRPLSEQFSNVNKSGEGPRYSASSVQKEINKDRRIGGKEARLIHSLLKGRAGDAKDFERGSWVMNTETGELGRVQTINGDVVRVRTGVPSDYHSDNWSKRVTEPQKPYGKRDAHDSDENPLKLATESEAQLATEYGDGTQFKKGDTVLHNHKKGTYRRTNDVRPVPIAKGANVAPMAKLIPRSKRPKAEDTSKFEAPNGEFNYEQANKEIEKLANQGKTIEQISKAIGVKNLHYIKDVLKGSRANDADVSPQEIAKIKKAYEDYKRMDTERLLGLWKRNHRISDSRGLGKAGLIADLLHDEFGARRVNAAFAKAQDASPFERDTDAGAERIVRREAKARLSADKIAKKYGFSLSFVKEVLGDVKPVGDAFKTIPKGTKVTWHYRSAIGHGTVTGVHKMGTTAANTTYSVHEEDHHPGEPSTVYHSGAALTRA